jgi:hypothetical protein
MKLTKVTMTGADDSVTPSHLLEISRQYPFVEWGILVSRNSQGNNRFPSLEWMDRLSLINFGGKMNLSCHLCGQYVKEILMGGIRFTDEIGNIFHDVNRIQVNTHGQPHNYSVIEMATAMRRLYQKEIIFQYDQVNTEILTHALRNGVNCSTLFDMSHGAGVLPKEWPFPIADVKCGYAGGLSPKNIEYHLGLIKEKVGDNEIWIDMETHIRSNHDQQFDLDKVVEVLEKCKPFIK